MSDSSAAGAAVHFVQQCDGPVFAGLGPGTLDCGCGRRLIDGYDPAYFIDIGLQCGTCSAVTTTPPLADDTRPPFAVVIAEPLAEPRTFTAELNKASFIISRAEMDRLTALYRPRTPDWRYEVTPELVDQAVAAYQQVTGEALPSVAVDIQAGLRTHALAWAVAHLRAQMQQGPWRADDGIPTPIAVLTLAGFLHFVAAWSHHPMFRPMVANVAAQRFSAHGLAPFVAAQCLSMMGNRIGFGEPEGSPPRLTGFTLATGPTDTVQVHLDVFDRFEVPFGQPWTPATLRAAVADRIAACAGRINPRHHGLLLLSPGMALAGFDEALIAATQEVLHSQGRRHRGLMAAAPVVLRLQQMPEPHAIRLCYGFFPLPNRHYEGDTSLQMGG
ncbi:MAG: hypothetical protein JSS43_11800 [Proteobacteria bacterium]|nr:hypothetical protein [Pseudomonadota bacterium]